MWTDLATVLTGVGDVFTAAAGLVDVSTFLGAIIAVGLVGTLVFAFLRKGVGAAKRGAR